ncbi:MAG: DUF3102 domain-containing protein [Verrucomicrobiales bacterium]|nr:DUF3102 domain-containing protein [Verrucomicrobiales bacterium]
MTINNIEGSFTEPHQNHQTMPQGALSKNGLDQKSAITEKEEEARKLHSELEGFQRTVLEKAIRIGELLSFLKERLEHGSWTNYLDSTLGIHPRSASNYKRIYDNRNLLKDDSGQLRKIGLIDSLGIIRAASGNLGDNKENNELEIKAPEDDVQSSESPATNDTSVAETEASESRIPEPDGDTAPPQDDGNEQSASPTSSIVDTHSAQEPGRFVLINGETHTTTEPWEESYPIKPEHVQQAMNSFAANSSEKDTALRKQLLFLGLMDAVNGSWTAAPRPQRADFIPVVESLKILLLTEPKRLI